MIGHAARNGIFEPLDLHLPADWLAEQERGSVGGSHESYAYDGHQWAAAIDAACQVAASRPDLLPEAPATFADVLALARRTGSVAVPLKPIDALSCFLTLCANQGEQPLCDGRFVSDELGGHVLEQLRELASVVAPRCLSLNPIEILTAMSVGDEIAYCPYAFGYTNYAREGYAPNRVSFHDIPAAGDRGCAGSTLGGAGIAVSCRSANVGAAMEYVRLVADPTVQRTAYVHSGGQPGHADAWDDEIANRITADFFRNTRRTIDSAYVRPTHDGMADLQSAAAAAVHGFLKGEATPRTALAALNEACSLIDSPG
jgi:multiple sugar transport system substrate-binding protein